MSDQGLGLSVTQDTLRDAFESVFRQESPIARVRSCEPLGFDSDLWDRLLELGVLAIAASGDPDERASLTDLVLIAEQRGRRLGSVPVVEALVATRAEARLSSPGDGWSTIALRAPIEGEARFIPWAPVADGVVAWDGARLVRLFSKGVRHEPNLGCLPLGHVGLDAAVQILADGEQAAGERQRMLADLHVLTAASLVGLANEALELSVDYVMERSAFGRLIGSFQSVAHRLADHVVALDGARLLTFEAAGRVEADAADGPALAAAAFANAAEVAEAVTVDGLHFHGGMGYTREFDIQLYLRRAKAWPLVAGEPWVEYCGLADGLISGQLGFDAHEGGGDIGAPSLPIAYHRDAGSTPLRDEVRAFFDEAYSVELRARRFDRPHDRDFLHRLRSWRSEAGARKAGRGDALFMEEADRAGYFYMDDGPSELVAAVLRAAGSASQRELAESFATGRLVGCLGFSEPGSGSDIAAARTHAARDGDGWIINGQKAFTTLADHATHVLLLTRTNSELPKHDGLTLFLVPLETPGIEIQPVHTLVTHATNMTYYDDVRVDDDARIGPVDGGWQVMKVALGVEQAGGRPAYARQLVEAVVEWLRDDKTDRGSSELVRERLGRAFVAQEIGTLLGYRNVWAHHAGTLEVGWGQGAKLFATEAYDRTARELMAAVGPAALLDYETAASAASGWPNFAFRDAPVRRIAGGASEVMRDFIAERRLGLPRLRT